MKTLHYRASQAGAHRGFHEIEALRADARGGKAGR